MHFFFSSRRRHTRFKCDWSSDVCSSDLFDFPLALLVEQKIPNQRTHQQTLGLLCLAPLSLKTLQVQSGEHYFVSEEAEAIDIEIEPGEAGRGSVGSVTIPYAHPTLSFAT